MSADDCFFVCFFLIKISLLLFSILVHIDRKNSESCFLFIFFFFRKYNLLILLYI